MVGVAERLRPAALLLALVSCGCGVQLVRPSVEPPAVEPRLDRVESLQAGVECRVVEHVAPEYVDETTMAVKGMNTESLEPPGTFNRTTAQALVEALQATGAFRGDVTAPAAAPGSRATCDALLHVTRVSEPDIDTVARKALRVVSVFTIVLIPLNTMWSDREPDLVERYALQVTVRGEPTACARYEVEVRGTISAQSPGPLDAAEGLEPARATLRDLAVRSLVSRFADDQPALARLREQLSDAPGEELEPLLVTKETDAPRARWRTRKVIGWKNESLGARVAEAKASELRALVSRLETCMLDLTHEAEVEKDAAQTLTASGADADAQGKREMSLAYRERVEVLRPILTAVKEELDGRSR